MKTLNEVIRAYEWCLDDAHDECDGCPYYEGRETDCHDRNVDALFYLREYVAKQEGIRRKEIRLDKAIKSYEPTKQVEQLEKMLNAEMDLNAELLANPELTWDELKAMEGKAVWIETDDNEEFWTVVDNFRTICNQECLCCSKGYMCRSTHARGDWQAYRKERSH